MNNNDGYLLLLIENAKGGRKTNYLEFCEFYYDEVFKLVYKLVPNYKLASEITEGVFIDAYSNLNYVTESTPFTYWFKSLAIRSVLSRLKEIKNFSSLSKSENDEEIVKLCNEEFQVIVKRFEELDPKLRIPFILYFFEDYTIREVTDLVGELFNAKSENFLMEASEQLFKGTKYEILMDLNILEWSNIEKQSLDSLSEDFQVYKPIIKEFYADFQYFFSKIASPTEIIENIKSILMEESVEVAQKRKKDREEASARIRKSVKKKQLKDVSAVYSKPKEKSKISEFSKSYKVNSKKKFVLNFSAIILIVFSISFYFYNKTEESVWTIDAKGHGFTIDGQLNGSKIAEASTIKTDEDGEIELNNEAFGKVTVLSDSEVVLAKMESGGELLKLNYGNIKVDSYASRILKKHSIYIPHSKIVDNGAKYNLEIDRFGNGKINVDEGILTIKNETSEILFSSGTYASIYSNKLNIPVQEFASRKMVDLIEEFNNSKNAANILDGFRKEYKETDGVTLWNLFVQSNGKAKLKLLEMVYEKFKPTITTDKNELLKGNEEAVANFRKEVEWQLF